MSSPQLRFKQFSEDWKLKKLGEVANKRIIKNKDNAVRNVFTNSAVKGIVNQRDYFDKDIANQNNLLGYYVVEKNDFVYNLEKTVKLTTKIRSKLTTLILVDFFR